MANSLIKLLFLCLLMCFVTASSSSQAVQIPDEPVKPKVTINRKEIPIIIGSYCWRGMNTDYGICSDPAQPDLFYLSIKEHSVTAGPRERVSIKFPIAPNEMIVHATMNDQINMEVEHSGGKFKLPSEPGYYRFVVTAYWDNNNEASYYFVVHLE